VRVRAIEDGVVLATLHGRRDPRIDALGLRPPEIVDLTADDGTLLYGLYYAPEPSDLPVPLVVSVYGGPHVQLVVDDWAPTVAMRAQALRRLGYAVLVVDNRGSARRGAVFERAIWRNLGVLEVADQVRGVRWAVAERNCDPKRVAIYGWSYGGYMALSCLTKAPELFGAAVAGAPVTDWDGYDTCYTERYMGTPLENADGYAAASVLNHVDEIAGDLLLVHGMIDENVHFRHTARLINRLVVAKKEHHLLCFPEERHLPRRLADRAFMEENVIGWLTDALAR
jgi:dipeptidyl-peptidase 4